MHRLLIVLVLSLLLALALAGLSAAQEDMQSSTSTVHLMSDGSEVEGSWSTLTRYENGVAATLHTSGLTPGDVVTAWWVIFNAPENCSDNACGADDVFMFDDEGKMIVGDNGPQANAEQREAAQISVLGATGNLIGESGEGHFAAWLGVGDVPGVLFGPALQNPSGAEIHVVLRTHGPMNDAFDEQITAFNGGCAAEFPNAPCQNIQAAVHQPA